MNTLTTTLIVTLSILVTVYSAPHERVKRQNLQGLVIPREFQNINFENYLKNPRAVAFQLKCIIYNGPCDSIGKYLKANFPNWLKTQCKNCTPSQKKQAGKAIEFFQTNYPKEWNDAVKKYRGTFDEDDVKRFESELGIKVSYEAPIPPGGAPKPDQNALAALAAEIKEAAKATPEPLVFESRTPKSVSEVSTSSTTPLPEPSSSTSASSSSSAAPVQASSTSEAATSNTSAGGTTEQTETTTTV